MLHDVYEAGGTAHSPFGSPVLVPLAALHDLLAGTEKPPTWLEHSRSDFRNDGKLDEACGDAKGGPREEGGKVGKTGEGFRFAPIGK